MDAKTLRLEDFAINYVSTAFDVASRSPSLGDFDNQVRMRVAEELKIPVEIVKRLHNPFHWSMFQEYKESPIELFQGTKTGDIVSVRMKRGYAEEDVAILVNYILSKHGNHLRARIPGVPIYEGDVLPASIPVPAA